VFGFRVEFAVAVSTVRSYYQILEDTLLGTQLLPWTKSTKRKAISTSKFYFFDIGIARHLQGRNVLERNSSDFGEAFETYLYHELKTYIDYCHAGLVPLKFWRSASGMEVNFILGEETAIEVKSSLHVTDAMLKGLRALSEERSLKHKIIVVPNTVKRSTADGILVLSYQEFLQESWEGRYVSSV
jgi:uncharacterized protein